MEVNNEQISLEIVKTPKKRGRKPKIKDTSEPIIKEKKKGEENLNQETLKMIYQRYPKKGEENLNQETLKMIYQKYPKKGEENQRIDMVLFLKIYQ